MSVLRHLVGPIAYWTTNEIAKWISNRASAAEKEASGASTASASARSSQLRPPQLPPIKTAHFLHRWLGLLADALKSSVPAAAHVESAPAKPERSVSAKVAGIVNLLNWPLFFGGVLLLLWLIADGILLAIDPALQARMASYASPVIMVLGPACVGYWTNWLAIKMLFHPRRPNKVWQGLIPARRGELIDTIADSVQEQLISPEIVRGYLENSGVLKGLAERFASGTKGILDNPQFRHELKRVIYQHLYALLTSDDLRKEVAHAVEAKVRSWAGRKPAAKVVMWITGFSADKLGHKAAEILSGVPGVVDSVLSQLDCHLDRLPKVVQEKSTTIEQKLQAAIEEGLELLDMRAVIGEQLEKMDSEKLECLLTRCVDQEIVFIQTAGGVLGALVGCSIVFPVFRPVLAILGLVLLLTYWRTVAPAEERVVSPSPRGHAEPNRLQET